MSYCNQCGTQIAEGSKFCPSCGTPAGAPAAPENRQSQQHAYQPQGGQSGQGHQPQGPADSKLSATLATPDTTAAFDPRDIEQNKTMAILSYFGILVLIPLLGAKESKFARYHANQGLALCIAAIIYGVAYTVLSALVLAISWRLYFVVSLLGLVGVVFLVLAILGIINAANGRAKELPLIGKFKILG